MDEDTLREFVEWLTAEEDKFDVKERDTKGYALKMLYMGKANMAFRARMWIKERTGVF